MNFGMEGVLDLGFKLSAAIKAELPYRASANDDTTRVGRSPHGRVHARLGLDRPGSCGNQRGHPGR
jgi:hypothetical protein